MRTWYLCYHSAKYPVTTFVHLDDEPTIDDSRNTGFEEPGANSTFINATGHTRTNSVKPSTCSGSCMNVTQNSSNQNISGLEWPSDPSDSVGHISHIPRNPPTQTTITIPTLADKSQATFMNHDEDLFGMIKLKDNDVCYTSGSIEWVGRKRSYPINSGFKVINEPFRQSNEPTHKKMKSLDKTYTVSTEKIKDCDCADVLPTVSAIVDHLNALHEAVDIVDLRLNTLEDVAGK